LAWIFSELNLNPSYMFGGLATGDFSSAALHDSEWSILEGDEYKSARWDNGPKFAHYRAKHLLLTAVNWDHAVVYPTEASYVAAFKKLLAGIPEDGMIVVSHDNANAHACAAQSTQCPRIITYGAHTDADYCYSNVAQDESGVHFEITYKKQTISLHCPLLGIYQAENITGAFALAIQLLNEPEKIAAAIATFPGLKRRMEKRYEGTVTVIDDIAHSPAKAQSVLENVRDIYAGRVIAVFEPNTGNRKPDALPQYASAFARADEVIIPRLTKIKIDEKDTAPPVEGDVLAATIKNTRQNTVYIDDDKELVDHLVTTVRQGDVIVFLGSHGFRGMIEELIKKLP
jgi:UDP-N-acetylmuramate: L-alanyl-gamma-D-glutamyl-meso-diaminopimelate ligase